MQSLRILCRMQGSDPGAEVARVVWRRFVCRNRIAAPSESYSSAVSSGNSGSKESDRGEDEAAGGNPKVVPPRRNYDYESVRAEVMRFDRTVPVEEAVTPPSSWYTDKLFACFEMDRVFGRGWQAVGYVGQVTAPGTFFTGSVGKVKYVVCRDQAGCLQAFHNVCRHHAAAVAKGSGCTSSFVCPYHGWTYGLDGRLQKATRLGGIRNFSAREYGLHPLEVATWGPFVLLSLQKPKMEAKSRSDITRGAESEWLGTAAERLSVAGIDTSLSHVARREYFINCNWKVYCDNYLDGGYHVPYAHQALAGGLNLDSYTTETFERASIQSCQAAEAKPDGGMRLGSRSTYAFVYPNFMINRYGPWMDTNLVLPLDVDKCCVVFDYFLETSMLHDATFIDNSLKSSEVVQDEDILLCEQVQSGMDSPVYDVGRYAPRVEHAMHQFHCLLHRDLCRSDD